MKSMFYEKSHVCERKTLASSEVGFLKALDFIFHFSKQLGMFSGASDAVYLKALLLYYLIFNVDTSVALLPIDGFFDS